MTRVYRRVSVVTVGLLAISVAAAAAEIDGQALTPAELFPSLHQAAKAAVQRVKPLEPGQARFEEMETEIAYLYSLWVGDKPSVPPDYLVTLAHVRSLLVEATGSADDLKAMELVDLAARDVALKYRYALALAGAQVFLPTTVVVTVEARRNNRPVEGFEVKCNPVRWASATPKFPFSNPTNNATRPLPPGFYKVWIERNKKEVASRLVEIGAAGTASETIIFLVE